MEIGCRFCEITQGKFQSFAILEDDVTFAFLDHRPLFHGHTLLVTKTHIETVMDLPESLIPPYFTNVQRLSRAVMKGMNAEGCFVALNNKISQSVPHLHTHIVPRRKQDGLKGFFWPRQTYKSEEEMRSAQKAIQDALREGFNRHGVQSITES